MSYVLGCLCFASLLLLPTSAVAWSNGGAGDSGYGTHDWVLDQANEMAVGDGYSWLDMSVALAATDDPDTKLHDTYYHIYDIWGTSYGDSPGRVAELYAETVRGLRAGDRAAASKSMGLLSHYYSDTSNPLHTDQTVAEKSMHSEYELDAQAYTDGVKENSSWVVPDGLVYVSDPRQATCVVASSANVSYSELVNEYSARGMDSKVTTITRVALNRAANGLADLIMSAEKDAESGHTPQVSQTPIAPVSESSNSTKIVDAESHEGQAGQVPTGAPESRHANGTRPAPVARSAEGSRTSAQTDANASHAPQGLMALALGVVFASALFGALSEDKG